MKEKTRFDYVVAIIGLCASIVTVVCAILYILNMWQDAVNVCVPMLSVVNLCQAYSQWNVNRKVAYFSLAVAGIIFICAIVVFFAR